MKKILSFILALLILSSIAVLPAFAEDADTGMHISSGDFVFEYLGNSQYSLFQYHGNDTEVTVPATFEGGQVVSIGSNAFEKNLHVRSVTIEDGVTSIGERAFAFCKMLSYVKLPNTLKSVDSQAFLYCTRLLSISIPESLISIGDKAFGYNRRTLSTETLEYSYQIDWEFGINGTDASLAKKYAEENGCRRNQYPYKDNDIFDFWFEIPTEWKDYKQIYCHFNEVGSDSRVLTTWGSQNSECYFDDYSASFDVQNFGGLEYGTVYEVIFYTDNGYKTHPAVLTAECESDTLYTNHTYVAVPSETEHSLIAYWKDTDTSAYEEALNYWDNAYIYTETPVEKPKDEPTCDEKPPITALPYGDADTDGVVTIKDATAIQKHLAQLKPLSDTGYILADFLTHSGFDLTIANATYIQKYCAGLQTMENIGKPAYTEVTLLRPEEWSDDLTIFITSWNDETTEDESKYHTWATPQTEGNYSTMEFYIPIYNPYLVIYTEESSSAMLTLNLPEGNDENNRYYAIAESWAGYDDNGFLRFTFMEPA